VPQPGSGDRLIEIRPDDPGQEPVRLTVPRGATLVINDGAVVGRGTPLTHGPRDPRQLAALCGLHAALEYLVAEIQHVYRANNAAVDDRHIEVLVRQLARMVVITEAGTTDLAPGERLSARRLAEINAATVGQGGTAATAAPVLLGMTQAALESDGWLSSASFQNTTQVLTAAALAGADDPLLGLKERVIVGQLIPAGSGLIQLDQRPSLAATLGRADAATFDISGSVQVHPHVHNGNACSPETDRATDGRRTRLSPREIEQLLAWVGSTDPPASGEPS
jgi:DNA-directed RNA polymerase subunit beta'